MDAFCNVLIACKEGSPSWASIFTLGAGCMDSRPNRWLWSLLLCYIKQLFPAIIGHLLVFLFIFILSIFILFINGMGFFFPIYLFFSLGDSVSLINFHSWSFRIFKDKGKMYNVLDKGKMYNVLEKVVLVDLLLSTIFLSFTMCLGKV